MAGGGFGSSRTLSQFTVYYRDMAEDWDDSCDEEEDYDDCEDDYDEEEDY